MKYIEKASGEREPFSITKVRRSLLKAGAQEQEIVPIVRTIKKEKPQSTQALHRIVMQLLTKTNRPAADRYNLKRGIMELGPEGYPFETFIGELFRAQGFEVQTSLVLPGVCVDHEVDGVAKKDNAHYMIETKFHNHMGIKSDVKVALYVHARFEDVCAYWKQTHASDAYQQVWLITNTKFTKEAIKYGRCKNMNLIGWNYPEHNNLAQLVEQYNLFPITTLSSLRKRQKKALMEKGIVMCADIHKHKAALRKIGLSDRAIQKIIDESQAVCKL